MIGRIIFFIMTTLNNNVIISSSLLIRLFSQFVFDLIIWLSYFSKILSLWLRLTVNMTDSLVLFFI